MSIPRFKVRPEIRRARHISECSTNSDVPLQFTNSSYTGDGDTVSRSSTDSQEMTVPTPLETSLQRDGLCQNTYENISIAGNLDSFEEKIDTRNTVKGVFRVPSQCRTALILMLCFMSAFSLILSLMMVLGIQMNSNCSCYSAKEGELSRRTGNGDNHFSENSEIDEKSLYKMLLANMTKLEEKLNDLKKHNYEQCQELAKKNIKELENRVDVKMHILETRLNQSTDETNEISNDVDTKMNATKTKLRNSTELLETTALNLRQDMSTKINNVKNLFWTTLNNSVDIIKKEFGDYYKHMNNTLTVQENKIFNITQIQKQSMKILEENHTRISANFNKMGKAIKVAMMSLNETRVDLDAANFTLQYEMQTLRSDVLNKIQNISKMEGPQGPQGPKGPPGVQGQQGLRGPPGFNGTSTPFPGMASSARNFSCQSKNKTVRVSAGGPFSPSTSVSVTETMGKRIVGATCSSDRAQTFSGTSVNNGAYKYICKCKGLNKNRPYISGTMSCIVHFWECHIVT